MQFVDKAIKQSENNGNTRMIAFFTIVNKSLLCQWGRTPLCGEKGRSG